MRFRAKLTKELLPVLLSVASTLEKIGDTAVIILDPLAFRICLVTVDAGASSPRCYSELTAEDYKIESQNENLILFEIGMSQFSRALSSGKSSASVQLKLVKRDNSPCLCFETKALIITTSIKIMIAAQDSPLMIDVSHDIPIKVLKSTDVMFYMPPSVPAPKVALDLPKTKLMKTIIDKLTKITKSIHMTANQNGKLVFIAEHPSGAVIKTFYNSLQPRYIGTLSPQNSKDNHVTVKLNLKILSLVLNLNNLAVDVASFFITEDDVVLLHITLFPPRVGTLTYYLPVLVVDLEDEES